MFWKSVFTFVYMANCNTLPAYFSNTLTCIQYMYYIYPVPGFQCEFNCDVCCVIGLTYYGKFSNYNIHLQCTNMLYTHLYICLQSCITLVSCLLHVMTDITNQYCFNYFSITITFKISVYF